eukprot:202187-Pyramimonas_sp.AAC.1
MCIRDRSGIRSRRPNHFHVGVVSLSADARRSQHGAQQHSSLALCAIGTGELCTRDDGEDDD